MPTFAFSPDKNKGDKTRAEELTPPPPTWSLHIHVMDTVNQCSELTSCTWGFFIESATIDCIGVSTWSTTKTYSPLQQDYNISISDDYPCVIVRLVRLTGSCSFTPQETCDCRANNQICKFKICP